MDLVIGNNTIPSSLSSVSVTGTGIEYASTTSSNSSSVKQRNTAANRQQQQQSQLLRPAIRGTPPDLTSRGYVQIGYHPEESQAAYYDVGGASADLKDATLNARYFSVSLYLLASMAWLLRIFTFFVALFTGGIALAELLILFFWVEPLIIIFVWTKHLALLRTTFWITIVTFLAKGVYLALWIYSYWGNIDSAWWWVVTGTVGFYALIMGVLLPIESNITKSKLLVCCLVNDFDRINQRLFTSVAAATAASSTQLDTRKTT
jgi:hypothetical protein